LQFDTEPRLRPRGICNRTHYNRPTVAIFLARLDHLHGLLLKTYTASQKVPFQVKIAEATA